MPGTGGVVLFGDVVRSRLEPDRATAWLRALTTDLDSAYAAERLAPFGFTQGDELQGLLRPSADPFQAVLRAGLHPDRLAMRWALVAGEVDLGHGPATQRTGPAFIAARDALERARARRDGLVVVTGDDAADRLLDDIAPLLSILVHDLSPRQQIVARLAILDGERQTEIAERLGVSRPTVSVLVDRGRVREIERLWRALRTIFRDGSSRVASLAGVAS